MAPPNGYAAASGEIYKPVPSTENISYKRTDTTETELSEEKGDDLCVEEVSSSGGDAEAMLVVPPDGGWGWVVVFASFCCNMVVDGIIFSYGMFITDITNEFQVSKAQVTLVGSLLSGFYLMAGPFVSALANRYGFRSVAILGSIIGAAAFVLSAFTTNIEYLFLSYGIIGGIGFGLVYVPAVITVGFYFEKWRALATGIAVCGSGIGTFLFAPLSSTLIESFGWRNALLVQAVLVLSCGIFGAMFRPIKPVKISANSRSSSESSDLKCEKENDNEKEVPLLMRIKFSRDQDMRSAKSTASLSSLGLNRRNKLNNQYPTAEEYLGKSMTSLHVGKSTLSLHANGVLPNPTVAKLSKSEKRLSNPVMSENLKFAAQNMDLSLKKNKEGLCHPLIGEKQSDVTVVPPMERRNTIGEKHIQMFTEDVEPDTANVEIQRPFYRDDIFFGASLHRLPQYASHTSLGYHMSVTRLPTENDVREEKESGCKICPEAVTRTLNTMLDISLLKSPSFMLLAVSGFFTMMGFYVPFMFLTDRALRNGMEVGSAMWLISAIGIANTIGRVLCGVITSLPGCNAMWINNVSITISGIATLLSGISYLEEYQFFYAVLFGLTISCFASLRSVLIVELVGLERLTNAFGLILLFQGIAAAAGAPIACAFMEATKSDDISFYFSGGLITFSALLSFPVSYVNKWEKRKAEEAGTVCV